MTHEERANREVAMRMLEHLGKNNSAGILGMLADKCEFHVGSERTRGIVPWHGVHVGHDEIHTYLNKRKQYLHRDNCGFGMPERGEQERSERGDGKGGDIERLIVDGDTVVAIGRLIDSFRGESGKPSSHMYTSDFVLVFQIVGGKIKKFQYFHDTDAVVQAWLNKYPGGRFARDA